MTAFPTAALLPKAETQADRFLALHPEADGRGTVVAILDTGVDPGAAGLQVTTTGDVKIVDMVDATGSGDVDTSLVLTPDADGVLSLPDGRTLRLNSDWKPSADGKYHVGSLPGFHVFPKTLIERLKTERKRLFDIEQREAVNAAQAELAAWTKLHDGALSPDAKTRQEKKELLTKIAVLNDLEKSYDDVGPIYDCVVFFDGEHWRAALDTKESGDFADVPAMTDYKIEHQFASFSAESQFNYALNIYDEGNTLSVVCDAGAHGTHVAGIVGAYYPEQPDCNGVAPGAQIISVKIGDARLGSMETTAALSRGILAVIQRNVDVVNMSYGEYAGQHNSGRIIDLLKELVDQHNVTFVCSAGNNGPAHGTVGAPGGTSSCAIGVGAYVSPQMMEAEYSMRDNDLKGIAFTWSSRGPTFDGDLGVDVCAPGAAVSPVPQWTLTKKLLYNGTSMASPNCAGSIALIISALKSKGISHTPYSIRRALQLTASQGPNYDPLVQGKGLIQVEDAYEYLEKHANTFDGTKKFPLYYTLTARAGHGAMRGILLRDAVDFAHDQVEANVSIKPQFCKDADQPDKVAFDMHLRLVPSARWIEVGHMLELAHDGRVIKVLVTTKHLTPGEHVAEIAAYDTDNEARGVVFSIPVIVIKPEPQLKTIAPQSNVVSLDMNLEPGAIVRRFLTVPMSATWADIVISREETSNGNEESTEDAKLYFLSTMQWEPFTRQSRSALNKALNVRLGAQAVSSVDLVGGITTEFCIAQFWSSLGASRVHMDIRFHGISPFANVLSVLGGEEAHRVVVSSDLQCESLAPQVTFSKWTQRIRPQSAVIAPLCSTRDRFPDQRQVYELVLTYPFSQKEAGQVTPRLPTLMDRLYESPFESQLSMIFDDKKKYIGTSDAYGDAVSVPKGDFIVKTQVRLDDIGKLERLKSMVLFLDHSLKDVTAPVFASPDDPALGGKPLSAEAPLDLPVRKIVALFIGEPATAKLPAGHAVGDALVGKVVFGKQNAAVPGAGHRPSGFEVTYVIPPAAIPEKETDASEEGNDTRDEETQALEAVRDLRISRLIKLIGKPSFTETYDRLIKEFPKHLPLVQAKLHHLDAEKDRAAQLAAVIAAADDVIALIDQDALAKFYGLRADASDEASKKLQKEKNTEKETLVDALTRKTRALGDEAEWDAFLAAYQDLKQWADVEKPAFVRVALLHDTHIKASGLALQRLRSVAALDTAERAKIMAEDVLQQEIRKLLEQLGWKHWSYYEANVARVQSPRGYRRF